MEVTYKVTVGAEGEGGGGTRAPRNGVITTNHMFMLARGFREYSNISSSSVILKKRAILTPRLTISTWIFTTI